MDKLLKLGLISLSIILMALNQSCKDDITDGDTYTFDISVDAPGVFKTDQCNVFSNTGDSEDVQLPGYAKTFSVYATPSKNPKFEKFVLQKNEKGAIAEEVSVNEISDEYSFPSGATVTKDTEGAYVFNNLPSEGYSINVLLNMDASEKNGKVLSETAKIPIKIQIYWHK